jgi:hypothetical protein
MGNISFDSAVGEFDNVVEIPERRLAGKLMAGR